MPRACNIILSCRGVGQERSQGSGGLPGHRSVCRHSYARSVPAFAASRRARTSRLFALWRAIHRHVRFSVVDADVMYLSCNVNRGQHSVPHAYTRTCTQAHGHAQDAHPHTRTRTLTRTQTLTHSLTQSPSLTPTHTCTHKHTYPHTLNPHIRYSLMH